MGPVIYPVWSPPAEITFPGEINVFRVRNRLQRIQSRIKR